MIGPLRCQEQVLDQLLSDGRSSAPQPPALDVVFQNLLHFDPVEAVMLTEPAVFRRDHCMLQNRRNPPQRDKFVALLVSAMSARRLERGVLFAPWWSVDRSSAVQDAHRAHDVERHQRTATVPIAIVRIQCLPWRAILATNLARHAFADGLLSSKLRT